MIHFVGRPLIAESLEGAIKCPSSQIEAVDADLKIENILRRHRGNGSTSNVLDTDGGVTKLLPESLDSGGGLGAPIGSIVKNDWSLVHISFWPIRLGDPIRKTGRRMTQFRTEMAFDHQVITALTRGRIEAKYTMESTTPMIPVKIQNSTISAIHIPFDDPAAVNAPVGREIESMSAQIGSTSVTSAIKRTIKKND